MKKAGREGRSKFVTPSPRKGVGELRGLGQLPRSLYTKQGEQSGPSLGNTAPTPARGRRTVGKTTSPGGEAKREHICWRLWHPPLLGLGAARAPGVGSRVGEEGMTAWCHPLLPEPLAPAQAFLCPRAQGRGCERNCWNPRPLSISSSVLANSVGKTIFPEAWWSAPHRQSGTTQWNNQGCHSQSSLHRRRAH